MLSSRSLNLAVLGLCVAIAGCNRESGGQAQPHASASAQATQGSVPVGMLDRSHKGSRLPDFTLSDQAGNKLQLASLAGKPLLINLWATWCAPCVVELPQLDKIAGEGRIRVLTISQDMQKTDQVADFLAQRGGRHLEPWLDPRNDLAFHYEAGTLPTTILYNAEGREIWRYVGGHDWSGEEARKMLAEAR